MRKFSASRRLLFAGGAVSILLVGLVLLPKLGFDLPGFLKSPRGLLRTQACNAGALAGKSMAWWDSFRENYRIKARRPETELLKEQAQKLDEKYGVKVDYPASAKVSSWKWGYTEGYNSIAIRALDDKFHWQVEDDAENCRISLVSPPTSEVRSPEVTPIGDYRVVELRAYGFSETGRSLVIATSADLTIFTRALP